MVRILVWSRWWKSAEYDMAEFFSLKGKRVGVDSDKDKFSISSAILGRRISAEVISPGCLRAYVVDQMARKTP